MKIKAIQGTVLSSSQISLTAYFGALFFILPIYGASAKANSVSASVEYTSYQNCVDKIAAIVENSENVADGSSESISSTVPLLLLKIPSYLIQIQGEKP